MRTSRILRVSCVALSLTCLLAVAACGGSHHKNRLVLCDPHA